MTNPQTKTVISTWIIEDDNQSATYFPQMRGESSDRDIKLAYWQCVFVSFASSLAVNPNAVHRLYTNAQPPNIGTIDGALMLAKWGVEVVVLPITYRIMNEAVTQWGNQFYIIDILKHIAENSDEERHIILDSDCVWYNTARTIERAIDRHGILTYDVYRDMRDPDRKINGVSERDLERFMQRNSSTKRDIIYCGGEIFAATTSAIRDLIGDIDNLWEITNTTSLDAPTEEAHFLSLLYAMRDVKIGTANQFIRRIWTSIRSSSACSNDLHLTIWHLPAEKRLGFKSLFAEIETMSRREQTLAAPKIDPILLEHHFGIPQRTLKKTARDYFKHAATRLRAHF